MPSVQRFTAAKSRCGDPLGLASAFRVTSFLTAVFAPVRPKAFGCRWAGGLTCGLETTCRSQPLIAVFWAFGEIPDNRPARPWYPTTPTIFCGLSS